MASDIDADKVHDYHTAFDIKPTKVKANVPLDINRQKNTLLQSICYT